MSLSVYFLDIYIFILTASNHLRYIGVRAKKSESDSKHLSKKATILIKNCQKQKQGSEKALYEHFFAYGMSVSLRYTATYEEAVEVLNDSFMKVFKIDQKLQE